MLVQDVIMRKWQNVNCTQNSAKENW